MSREGSGSLKSPLLSNNLDRILFINITTSTLSFSFSFVYLFLHPLHSYVSLSFHSHRQAGRQADTVIE